MEASNEQELLGIACSGRNYAVDISWVEEICFDIAISKLPCLPPHFAGVFNYRGDILPAVCLEKPEEGGKKGRVILLVIRYKAYRLGIVIPAEPYMIPAGVAVRIDNPPEAENHGIWKEKEIYQTEQGLTFLIDIEETVSGMVVYQ